MLTQVYSYRPRSGSRVVAAAASNEHVAICAVQSGTIAVGDLVQISVFAATPGHHYRNNARRLGEQLIPLTGGMCEDDRGCVTYAVPRHRVAETLSLLTTLLPLSTDELQEIHAQLWRQHAAEIESVTPSGVTWRLTPAADCAALTCVPGWRDRAVQVDDGETTGDALRIPALYFVARGAEARPVCVTDKGRAVRADLDGIEYSTPTSEIGFVQIQGSAIDDALRLLGLDPLARVGAAEYADIPTPYGPAVAWTAGGDEYDECLQVAHAPGIAPSVMADLADMACQVNWHADFPAWAGWREVFRDAPVQERTPCATP